MFRMIRRLPFFKVVAIVQLALLARRHLGALTPDERRRMAALARAPAQADAGGAHGAARPGDEARAARVRGRGGGPSVAVPAAAPPDPRPRVSERGRPSSASPARDRGRRRACRSPAFSVRRVGRRRWTTTVLAPARPGRVQLASALRLPRRVTVKRTAAGRSSEKVTRSRLLGVRSGPPTLRRLSVAGTTTATGPRATTGAGASTGAAGVGVAVGAGAGGGARIAPIAAFAFTRPPVTASPPSAGRTSTEDSSAAAARPRSSRGRRPARAPPRR